MKNTCLGFYVTSATILLMGVGILLYTAGIAGMSVSYIAPGFIATLSLLFIPASYRDIPIMLSFAPVGVGILLAVAYVVARLYSLVERSPGKS